MRPNQVPPTAVIGADYRPEKIRDMLALAVAGQAFTHVEPINDLSCSARVLARKPLRGMALASLKTQMWPWQMAVELQRLANTGEARYDTEPHPGMRKGWRVCAARINGDFAAIVYATWV
jgi:hypothetical protein